MSSQMRTLIVATACGVLLSASIARPVIITSDSDNFTAPLDCPAVAHVGAMGSGSFVYLGNRWCVTAKHVFDDGIPESVYLGGEWFELLEETVSEISPGNNSDIAVFRLATEPDLETLEISPRNPPVGTRVIMAGVGLSNGGFVTHPTESYPGFTVEPGYGLVRWGENDLSYGESAGWWVTFEWAIDTGLDEACPATGDSGGGMFPDDFNGALAGLMNFGVHDIPNNPVDLRLPYGFFPGDGGGGRTLAKYREAIIAITGTGVMGDTDADGDCDIQDYINVVNNLGNTGSGVLGDTNGDDVVNAQDYANVVNHLGDHI